MPARRAYVPHMSPMLMTAEELLHANIPDKRTELVRGVLRVREPAGDRHVPGFPELAPDLVVEVLSPGDRAGETRAKVGDWLEAGARLVWVVDPERRLACVYRQGGSETSINEEEQLDGEDVLPGFACRLASIL